MGQLNEPELGYICSICRSIDSEIIKRGERVYWRCRKCKAMKPYRCKACASYDTHLKYLYTTGFRRIRSGKVVMCYDCGEEQIEK